jgi:branched-chain amino acid transport system permease protein
MTISKTSSYAFGVMAVLAMVPLMFKQAYFLDIAIMVMLWASLAGSWNIIGGYAGQLSLGHSAFIGIGAYTSSLLFINYQISPWVGMIIGAIISAIVGALLSAVCFRLKGPFFCLGTIAFGEVLKILATNTRSITGGSEGLVIPFEPSFVNFMFRNRLYYYYLALLMTFLILQSCHIIERSRLGYRLIASRQAEDAAFSIGIKVNRVRVIAMAISAAFTAICGTFYAQYILFLEPDSVFSLGFSIQPALITIVGGISSAFSPFIGSLIIIPMEHLLRGYLGNAYGPLYIVIYGSMVALVVLFLPNGVEGLFKENLKRLMRHARASGC